MASLKPAPARVIRYSYLWHSQYRLGSEEGIKDRPCAVVLAVQGADGRDLVTVLPISHSPPRRESDALEIPPETKRRLGLDHAPSWVVLTEANRFSWPGPDVRPGANGDLASVAFGYLPAKFFDRLRTAFLAQSNGAAMVQRTE